MSAVGRPATRLPRLVAALMVVVLLPGCLFPPVDPGDGSGQQGGDAATPTLVPDDFVIETAQQARSGGIGPGLSVGGATYESEPVDERFTLPPRLTWFELTLDWRDEDATNTGQTHIVHDLDLRAVLHILNEPETDPVWGPKVNDNGTVGNSDAPALIESPADDAAIAVTNRTVLTATILPEARATNVTWVLTVHYRHLVARAAA